MWQFQGLPVHVLLVHAVVVLVPVAATAVVASAWVPAVRRRLGIATLGLAVLSLVLTPLTAEAGQWLQQRRPATRLVADHVALGERLWLWVVGLVVAAVLVHVLGTWADNRSDPPGPGTRATVAVLATVLAVAAAVQTVRTGESGSRSVWEGTFTEEPLQ